MHALIVAASGAPSPDRPGDVAGSEGPQGAAALAAAWTGAAPRCATEPLVVPVARPAAPPSPGAPAPAGVFVPTSALGLSSVGLPPVPPHVALMAERAADADLVVVHVRTLDGSALHDGPVADAARAAAPHAVPVVVLAGRSEVSRRELAAAGVAGVHEVGDPWDPSAVRRAARTWAPPWSAV
ncbi:hypothetical protein GCM10009718_32720 [Isoptericola halotolerans]|uniref:Uncharacterized protein n=1 Tax=Isoptericola halotolerans TaxID=300560 RepID=A0ABX2AAA6_9MICO|nr:glycerate kinase [Isoptericola halotolerans]NOV99125.1 hypothetical protein [Isoptericola halotolerans]